MIFKYLVLRLCLWHQSVRVSLELLLHHEHHPLLVLPLGPLGLDIHRHLAVLLALVHLLGRAVLKL